MTHIYIASYIYTHVHNRKIYIFKYIVGNIYVNTCCRVTRKYIHPTSVCNNIIFFIIFMI